MAGVTAPIFAHFGNQWGPKLLYNAGAFLQGFAGISFGLLEYVDGTAAFLGLSYFLRYLKICMLIVLLQRHMIIVRLNKLN